MKTSRIMATKNFIVRLIRKRKNSLTRLIDTVGLLSHIVAGQFIGTSPTASTDPPIFTPAALSMITIHVSQGLKDFRGVPDLLKRPLPHVATVQLKIATGLNPSQMGDETEGDSSQAPPGHGIKGLPL
jgi:hypothetical protein